MSLRSAFQASTNKPLWNNIRTLSRGWLFASGHCRPSLYTAPSQNNNAHTRYYTLRLTALYLDTIAKLTFFFYQKIKADERSLLLMHFSSSSRNYAIAMSPSFVKEKLCDFSMDFRWQEIWKMASFQIHVHHIHGHKRCGVFLKSSNVVTFNDLQSFQRSSCDLSSGKRWIKK